MTEPTYANEVTQRKISTVYPPEFARKVEGRTKRALGDYFGLTKFGVNLTELAPGASSALLHRHSLQEEFVYVLSGHPTVILDNREIELSPGMCIGFRPNGEAHKLVNKSSEPAVYLEVGDRIVGDEATYPEDDIVAKMDEEKKWVITHKDGRPY